MKRLIEVATVCLFLNMGCCLYIVAGITAAGYICKQTTASNV
jgi:hypothetical protein